MEDLRHTIEGKIILVTGGTGSIGQALVKKLLQYNPKSLRIFDNNENSLFWMKEKFNDKRLRFFFGDVRDLERLKYASENVDIFIHTAAMKHVVVCEYNPFDAVKTNVLGTQNSIAAAMEANVERFLLISTDKSVNPISVMGATKMLAERFITTTNNFKGDKRTIFSCVRFGNVIGSSGSAAQLFEDQINTGGPLTITNGSMTRFIMPLEKATELVLRSLAMAKGGEIFILKMPALNLLDLAEAMVELSEKKIEIKEIGIRAGEKIHEELMTEHEAKNALETDTLFVLGPNGSTYPSAKPATVRYYRSSDCSLLSKEEIKQLLMQKNA